MLKEPSPKWQICAVFPSTTQKKEFDLEALTPEPCYLRRTRYAEHIRLKRAGKIIEDDCMQGNK